MVSIVLSAVAAVLVWRVGRRTIGERKAAVAAALFWIWPPFNFIWLTREYGFYGTDLVYCSLLLLLSLRVVERPDRLRVGLFGLVLGLAFWQTAQIIPIAGPALAWTVWKRPACIRHVWVAAGLAVVGALPWIVWNVTHGWASLMARAGWSEYSRSLRLLASPLVPMTLGLRAPLTAQAILPKPAMYLVYVGLLALFAYGAFATRRSNASLLYCVTAAFPFVWAISRRVSSQTSDPMYLIVVTPLLALLLAQVATRYSRAATLLALACVVSIVTLQRMETWLAADRPHWPPSVPRNLGPLISTLQRLGVDRVYSDYWVAYRLDFDSGERIVAAQLPSQIDGVVFDHGRAIPSPEAPGRYPPYQRVVRDAAHGFVFYRATASTGTAPRQLASHGYRRHVVGPFVIYAPPARDSPSRSGG